MDSALEKNGEQGGQKAQFYLNIPLKTVCSYAMMKLIEE